MNDTGRAYAIQRLSDAPTLSALRTVWVSLGKEYQNDPAIQKLKDDLKANHARDHRNQ